MKKILYIFLPALSLLIISCNKTEIDTWSGLDRIGFTTAVMSDTVRNYSFVFESEEVMKSTVLLQVSTEGRLYDYPRYVTIRQVPSGGGNDAVAGIHYVPFDDPEVKELYVIPAGANTAYLPIVLLRDASLQHEAKNLRIVLEENGSFLLSATAVRLHRTIIFTDMLSMPEIWESRGTRTDYGVERYFGYYGPVKHRFMIETTGLPFDDAYMAELFWWHNATWGWRAYDQNYTLYLQGFLQQQLEERNALEGNILTEADGRVVDFYDYP